MTDTAQKYVDGLEIPYTATFVPQSMSRNTADKNLSLNWLVSFGNIQTDYMQGIGHMPGYVHNFGRQTIDERDREKYAAEKGKTYRRHGNILPIGLKSIPEPGLVDVLYSLVMDSDVINYDCFEDWADCIGYDSDSRKAEEIYNACMKIALKLRKLINLEEAQEAFQDF